MSESHPTINPDLVPTNPVLNALCELIRQEKVILWVGSGFSRDAGYPSGSELSAIILESSGELPKGDTELQLTVLRETADYFVEKKGRDALIELLKQYYCRHPRRIDVHESLALINRVKYIITTNYDPLFELAYGDHRIVKIAHDEELPSSTDYPEKALLLKIHGDLSDPDSVVITSSDYDRFDKDSIVWGKIKALLAEYSVVFIGYSISDPNVEEMLQDIHKRLKGRKHPYYFIDNKIDEEKRVRLKDYGLHFIEMDTVAVIDYITRNAIQYAFIDGMKNPALFSKSDQIFEHQGFRVDRQFTGGKVRQVSLVPERPAIQGEFSLSLTSKDKVGKKLHELHDAIKGLRCDPVTISSSDCDIKIHDAKINNVFFIDPLMIKLKEIFLSPLPVKENIVDLQSQKHHHLRLNNLKMKVYGSPESTKLEIEDPDFKFTIRMSRSAKEGKINFTSTHIISNIDRARIIYGLFHALMEGETIELISASLPRPFPIKCQIQTSQGDSSSITGLSKIYDDLHEIQTRLSVKFQLPDEITVQDQKKIRRLSEFIRGKPQPLNWFKITITANEKFTEAILKNKKGELRFAGDVWCEVSLFGKTLKIPFIIESPDSKAVNIDEIKAAIERGDEDLPIIWKSETGHLQRKFSPINSENAAKSRNTESYL